MPRIEIKVIVNEQGKIEVQAPMVLLMQKIPLYGILHEAINQVREYVPPSVLPAGLVPEGTQVNGTEPHPPLRRVP